MRSATCSRRRRCIACTTSAGTTRTTTATSCGGTCCSAPTRTHAKTSRPAASTIPRSGRSCPSCWAGTSTYEPPALAVPRLRQLPGAHARAGHRGEPGSCLPGDLQRLRGVGRDLFRCAGAAKAEGRARRPGAPASVRGSGQRRGGGIFLGAALQCERCPVRDRNDQVLRIARDPRFACKPADSDRQTRGDLCPLFRLPRAVPRADQAHPPHLPTCVVASLANPTPLVPVLEAPL